MSSLCNLKEAAGFCQPIDSSLSSLHNPGALSCTCQLLQLVHPQTQNMLSPNTCPQAYQHVTSHHCTKDSQVRESRCLEFIAVRLATAAGDQLDVKFILSNVSVCWPYLLTFCLQCGIMDQWFHQVFISAALGGEMLASSTLISLLCPLAEALQYAMKWFVCPFYGAQVHYDSLLCAACIGKHLRPSHKTSLPLLKYPEEESQWFSSGPSASGSVFHSIISCRNSLRNAWLSLISGNQNPFFCDIIGAHNCAGYCCGLSVFCLAVAASLRLVPVTLKVWTTSTKTWTGRGGEF